VNISVDIGSPVPPYEQIRAGIAWHIRSGALPAETPLPPVRQLANDLGLAPGTIQRAYTELRLQGLVRALSRQRVVVVGGPDILGTDDVSEMRQELTSVAVHMVSLGRRLGLQDMDIVSVLRECL
jgi:GntR family transcriptional regulator